MTGRERNLDVVSPFLTFYQLFQSPCPDSNSNRRLIKPTQPMARLFCLAYNSPLVIYNYAAKR